LLRQVVSESLPSKFGFLDYKFGPLLVTDRLQTSSQHIRLQLQKA